MKLFSLLLLSVLLFVSGVTYAQLTPDQVALPPTTLNGLPPWITNPDQVMALIQKWGLVISGLGVAASALIAWVLNEVKTVKASLGDLHEKVDSANSGANSQSSNAATKQLNVEVTGRPTDPGKVWLLIPLLASLILFFPGCASNGSLTPKSQKTVATALGVLNLAIDTYAQFEGAKESGQKLNSGQIANLAKSDLAGIAQLAQANLGQTPGAAAIGDGAANPAVGIAVEQALPAKPITQNTVNMLYAAAK
jgi:hypothetical protein